MRVSWLIALCACHSTAAEEHEEKAPPAAVTCQAIAQRTIEDSVEVTGQIAPRPLADAVLSSPVAGRVAKVAVEEGDTVEANALLATVEDPALPAGTAEAAAAVAAARAAKEAADLELARQTRLVASGIGAQRDLDEARAKASTAAAELAAAVARAGLASRQLARREIRAPRAGVVLHVWKREGENVDGTTATPIAEVADVSVLELHAQVPPGMLVALHEKQPASIAVVGVDATLDGAVVRVAPAVDPTTLLGGVRIEVASGKDKPHVPVGSAATGRIVTGTHPGVAVPESALRRSVTGADELVVCEGNVARVRAVTVGQRGPQTEIVKGLKPAEKVVVDHPLGLEDGRALEVAGS